jgi:hypothetical protein
VATQKLVFAVDGNLLTVENRAQDIRHAPSDGVPPGPSLDRADLDAARQLAEFHRLLAAELAPHSQIRGLVLRCAGHWSRLGAIPRNGLAEAERRDLDRD